MSLMAESLFVCGLCSYAFTLMSNHLHNIAQTEDKQRCIDFLDHYGTRLRRFVRKAGRDLSLSDFVSDPIPILTLQSLRNNMVYVDRNGYVIYSHHTPLSYPWGTGFLYFGYSPALIPSKPLKDVPILEKRVLMHSRDIRLPETVTIRNGFVAPESFVDWRIGRQFFRDAHQYFNLLTKNREAYAEFAALYKDRSILTDEEMYSAAYSIARDEYHVNKLTDLTGAQKEELARKMHFDYNAGNAQIYRILKMDKAVLQEMFPETIV